MFNFLEFDDLEDSEIKLILKSRDMPDLDRGDYPRYGFSITRIKDNEEVGMIFFVVDTSRRQYLRGHLSYGISPAFRGHNYSMKACKLIKKVALAHGYIHLFIGAGYENIASIKTIEKLGARPIGLDDVPDIDIIGELEKEKTSMYVWNIVE